MLLSWIVKTIPRSPRAFLALVVMLISTSWAFSGLQGLFDPAGSSKSLIAVKIAVGLLIGLPSTVIFYWFQSQDESGPLQKPDLEVLNDYMEADRRERAYKEAHVTPVFDSRNGATPNNAGSTTANQPKDP